MSHYEAHILLDELRAGRCFPLHLINKALELTGDIEHIACSLEAA